MLKERNFNMGNLIRLGSAGLEVAEFVDIRDAIIQRYKEVYGSDIDLSTASADGVFVHDLALVINNILQVMRNMYSNLDVELASGTNLDTLCRLANVRRMGATHSTASLIITNLNDVQTTFDDSPTTSPLNTLTFLDKAGNEWVANTNITLDANVSGEITVTCTEAGMIDAPIGWIDRTMRIMNCSVEQRVRAIRGTNAETDDELRARRAQSSGANGTAVLESLVGALLEVSGIEDVKIYNNNLNVVSQAKDGTKIEPHSVYIIIRQQLGLLIDEQMLAELIYNKLTPGIRTTETTSSTDESIVVDYIPQMLGVAISSFETKVYWKRCLPICPSISISITVASTFVDSEVALIADAVFEYANNLKIGVPLNENEIFREALDADPLFRGQPTYTLAPNTIFIGGTGTNDDHYYHYSNFTYTTDDNLITITIT